MGQVDQATDAKLNRDQLGKKGQTMRRARVSLAVASVFLLGLVVTGQQVTVEGELVSAKCYLRADLTGNDHLEMEGCGTACVRSGNPVGLLTAEGMHYTLVIPAPEIADYIGRTLRARGTIKAGSVVPDQLEMQEGASWEAVEIDLM